MAWVKNRPRLCCLGVLCHWLAAWRSISGFCSSECSLRSVRSVISRMTSQSGWRFVDMGDWWTTLTIEPSIGNLIQMGTRGQNRQLLVFIWIFVGWCGILPYFWAQLFFLSLIVSCLWTCDLSIGCSLCFPAVFRKPWDLQHIKNDDVPLEAS